MQMLKAQKERELAEADHRTEQSKKVKDAMIDTLQHELDHRKMDERHRRKETVDLYETKLKLKEDQLFEARTELARLKGMMEGAEEILEEDIEVSIETEVTTREG